MSFSPRNISMCTVACMVLALAFGGTTAMAALIASDNFESYSAGAGLSGGSGGSGWAGNWTADAQGTVQSTILSDPNNLVSGGSKALRMMATSNASDIGNFMSRGFTAQTGDVYVSFLIRNAGGVDSADFYNFQVSNGVTGNTTAALGVGIRNATNNPFFARVGSSSSGQTSNASANATLNTTFLLVAKFSKASSSNYNRVDLYINPLSNTEPGSADATATSAVTGLSTLSLFTVRNFQPDTNDTVFFDELRIGTSFADVLPVPEPSTLLYTAIGLFALLRRRR